MHALCIQRRIVTIFKFDSIIRMLYIAGKLSCQRYKFARVPEMPTAVMAAWRAGVCLSVCELLSIIYARQR